MESKRDLAAISERIRGRAREIGFDQVGIAPIRPSDHAAAYERWVAAGRAGEMQYLTREDAVRKRENPGLVVEGARSAIVVGLDYATSKTTRDEAVPPDSAVFARYARGDDYHDFMKPRLIEFQEWISAELIPLNGRAYVDTGPVLERELAARAGLGWFGRNTLLIEREGGSYFFIGVILVDVELSYDIPQTDEFCGSCHRCLDACPTGALLGRDAEGAPIMDARRCISYLTIENRGAIPLEFRSRIGNRIYGCDICAEVCPHNNPRFVRITDEPGLAPRRGVQGASLIELMGMDQEEFSRRFRRSPVKRAKRRGLLRNVAVGLGNWGSPAALPALLDRLEDDEPLIRQHVAWAIGEVLRKGDRGAKEMEATIARLEMRLTREGDAEVREELTRALVVGRPGAPAERPV